MIIQKEKRSFTESFPYSFSLVFLAWMAITCITDMICICRIGTGLGTGTGLVIPITTTANANANASETGTTTSCCCCCKYFGGAK